MSNKNLKGFKDQAHRVSYAYKNTQRQYDEHPPNDDMVPIAAAINAWTLICGCYMGIEQTMKLLIRMRKGTPVRTHDLKSLYSSLAPSERDVVAAYYRVYRSLHNFDTGNISLETADEFIQHVGNGYVALYPGRKPRGVAQYALGLDARNLAGAGRSRQPSPMPNSGSLPGQLHRDGCVQVCPDG